MKNVIQLAVNNLRKSVTCSICLGYFNLPVTLACSHSYCADCIEPVIRSKRPCPICSSAIKSRNMSKELDISDMVGRVSAFVDSMDDFCRRTAQIPALVPAPEIPVRRTVTDLVQHVPRAVSTDTGNAMVAIVEVCSGVVPTRSGAVAFPSHVVRCFKVGDLVKVAARTFAGMNKPGGIGKVIAVTGAPTEEDDGGTTYRYSVKYVLDGLVESDLHAGYVLEYREMDRSARRQRMPDAAVVPVTSSGDHKRKLQCGDEASARTESNGSGSGSGTKLPKSDNTSNESADTASRKEPSLGVANRQRRTLVLLSTALDPYLQSKLTLLVERCPGVSVTNNFSDAVTHVVVDADKSRILKNRTMKYMQALITGRWIVSVQWVADSLKRHVLLAEDGYEVTSNAKASIPGAPRRARLALSAASAGLFSSHSVLLFGQFPQPGPAKSDIRFLLERGAAVLCDDTSALLRYTSEQSAESMRNVVVVTAQEYAEHFWREVGALRGGEGASTAGELSSHITVTSFTWVLDCVVNFSIMPFTAAK